VKVGVDGLEQGRDEVDVDQQFRSDLTCPQ
jgi:hypothetical protein